MSPVAEPDGAAAGSVLVGRDITERQLSQATLAEVEARLREGEALAHVGGWLWDVRTGAVQWSDEAHRIHGVDPLVFGGTLDAHMQCVHPDDRERVLEAMRSAVATGSAFDAEYRVVRADGDVRSVHSRASTTIGSARTVVGLRGMAQDVTTLRPEV
jgi:PAS domain S-box-containing protein